MKCIDIFSLHDLDLSNLKLLCDKINTFIIKYQEIFRKNQQLESYENQN